MSGGAPGVGDGPHAGAVLEHQLHPDDRHGADRQLRRPLDSHQYVLRLTYHEINYNFTSTCDNRNRYTKVINI